MARHESHGERHNQAADDQSCSSGTVERSPASSQWKSDSE
jgi:hypothetical protein